MGLIVSDLIIVMTVMGCLSHLRGWAFSHEPPTPPTSLAPTQAPAQQRAIKQASQQAIEQEQEQQRRGEREAAEAFSEASQK